MDEDDIAAIAASVVDLMTRPGRPDPATGRLVTASELAGALGVARSWVYTNKARLGAIRLGSGPRARLRFDLADARAAFDAISEHEPAAQPTPRRRRRGRRDGSLPAGVVLIKGRSER